MCKFPEPSLLFFRFLCLKGQFIKVKVNPDDPYVHVDCVKIFNLLGNHVYENTYWVDNYNLQN